MEIEHFEERLEASFNKTSLFKIILRQTFLGIALSLIKSSLSLKISLFLLFLGVQIFFWLNKTTITFFKNGDIKVNRRIFPGIGNYSSTWKPTEYSFVLMISSSNWRDKKFVKNDSWLVFLSDNEGDYFKFPGSHPHLALRNLAENLGQFFKIGIRDFTGYTPVSRAFQSLDTSFMEHIQKILIQEPGAIPKPDRVKIENSEGDNPKIFISSAIPPLHWFSFSFPLIFAFFFSLIQVQQLEKAINVVYIASVIVSLSIFFRCVLLWGLSTLIAINRLGVSVHQRIFNLQFKHAHFSWKKLENVRVHGGSFPFMEFISDNHLEIISVSEDVHNYLFYILKKYLYRLKPDDPEEASKTARKHLQSRVLTEK